jgi:hypothetical protein
MNLSLNNLKSTWGILPNLKIGKMKINRKIGLKNLNIYKKVILLTKLFYIDFLKFKYMHYILM